MSFSFNKVLKNLDVAEQKKMVTLTGKKWAETAKVITSTYRKS